MPIGYGSAAVNAQLVPVPVKSAFDPLTFGQAYTGPGMWPRQGVYNVPPVLPSGSLQSSMAPSAYGASGSGYTVPTPASETGNPFHPTKSPLIFALVFLFAGILMLQHIHYK
jgi:hypothetical protein